MKQLEGVINLDEEFSSLVSFVRQKWSVIDSFEDLMREAWIIGLDLYKSKSESHYSVSNKICDMGRNEEKYICSSLTDIEKIVALRYHPYKVFSKNLLVAGMRTFLKEPEESYYDLEKKLKLIIKKYPESKKMKPIGWNKLKKVYEEYMGMDEYDVKADENLFTGTNVANYERSFMLRISLPQVMYDELEQGNNRIVVLLMSVIDHAAKCMKHNNAQAFLNDIERIENYFLSVKENHPMPFDVSFEGIVKNNFFKEILRKSQEEMISLEEFNEKVEKQKEYEKLPEEEKQRRKAQSAELVLNMLKDKNVL